MKIVILARPNRKNGAERLMEAALKRGHDAKIVDNFDSDYMFWIDAGLANTVHPGYFTHDKVLKNLTKYISNFIYNTSVLFY